MPEVPQPAHFILGSMCLYELVISRFSTRGHRSSFTSLWRLGML